MAGSSNQALADYVAAAHHRRAAERHYVNAEKFRRLGLVKSQAAAKQAARDEDHIAELLSGVRR